MVREEGVRLSLGHDGYLIGTRRRADLLADGVRLSQCGTHSVCLLLGAHHKDR